MNLHYPAALGVLAAQEREHRGYVLGCVAGGHFAARHRALEYLIDLLVSGGGIRHVIQTVVAGDAAHLAEEVQTALQRGAQAVYIVNRIAADLAQLLYVGRKAGLVDVDGLVGTPCGQYLSLAGGVGRDGLVPVQIVHRVIGGADQGYVALLNNAAHAHVRLLQLCIAPVVNRAGVFFIDEQVAAEIAFQLQMRPVVQRVADCARQHLGIGQELFPVARVAGDIALVHARVAHHAPLVMVAAQPRLGYRLKAVIVGNLFGIDVAVVVQYGHCLGIVMIELLRALGIEQKIIAHELLHRKIVSFYLQDII